MEADNDEECDDGDVLSETDCCNQNCRFRAVQTLCGGVPVGPCDEQDRCDGRGHCVPRVREPQSRECRPLATIDDCDLGDFCDGSSADCPTTGDGAGCDATTPETVRGTVIPVSCTTILGVAKGTVSECSASGAEAVASQSITGAGATVPTLTNVARGNLKKGKKGTTERHRVLRLKLNKLGKALLKERGVLNVQVDVQITHGRAKGKTVQRLVTMLRKAS